MPKNRNRAVTNNFEFSSDFLQTLPYPEKVNGQKSTATSVNLLCFGEPIPSQYFNNSSRLDQNGGVVKKTYDSASSSEYDITSGVSDFDIISFGKSSSSSVSWSDEFDTEATQRVQAEFDRMERVLQGKEAIPAHYNRDEYEQWIKTFPQLSISGSRMKYPIQHKESIKAVRIGQEEVLAFHSDLSNDCDSDPTSSELQKIVSLKNAVIDQVFENISSKLLYGKSIKRTNNNVTNKPKNQQTELLHPNDTQLSLANQFDSFLRISPVLLQESPNRTNRLDTRQQSSHSVSKSEKLASKWMREEPIEYSSLPYLSAAASAKSKPRKTIGRKNSASSKARYLTKLSPPKNNYIALPPIKATVNLPSTNQYRSISATPRHPSKGLSAVSMQADSLARNKKSRFEVANHLVSTELQSKKKGVKHPKVDLV